MDWIDVVVVGYVVIGALTGLRRGLVLVLFSLAGYVAGIAIAARFGGTLTQTLLSALPVKKWVAHFLPAPAANVPGATVQAYNLAHIFLALLVFLLVIGAAEFVGRLAGEFATHILRAFKITGALNKLGGGLAGLAEHSLVAGLVLTIILAFPMIAHSPMGKDLHHAPIAMLLVGWFNHLSRLGGGFLV